MSSELDFGKHRYKSPTTFDRKWLEWFREEFARNVFRVDMEPGPDTQFLLDGTTRLLPSLAIYGGECSPMRTRRLAGCGDEDAIALTVPLQGHWSSRIEGADFDLAPGNVVVATNTMTTVVEARSSARLLGITLSSRLLSPLVPNLCDIARAPIPTGSQAMRLLLGYIRMLEAEETIATPEARQLAVTHVHDLVALALGGTEQAAEDRSIRAGRLAAVKQDILTNLAEPRLSIGDVAGRQAVTPRYVSMLFKTDGTSFTEFVISHRLARAHRMLCDPRSVHLSIAAIALSVGFGDLSYFNRIFRRRYGATPTETRRGDKP